MEFLMYPKEEDARDQAQADAQALADVRTLDDWADSMRGGGGWQCFRQDEVPGYRSAVALKAWDGSTVNQFKAATPEAARAKAAAWVREQAKGAK